MKVALTFILMFSFLFQEKTSTNDLLKNPFNLQEFKKAKGPSNSGVADVQPYYFKPEEKGVYFRFFIFKSLHTYIFSENGNQKIHVPYGTGFQIITYKPVGKYRDSYLDPTETLIEVTTSYNDPDLPELAFVGLDTMSIKKKLGSNFIRKDNYFIYSNDDRALVLSISDGAVKCLKYARLNTKLTKSLSIEGLTEMNCKNQPVR